MPDGPHPSRQAIRSGQLELLCSLVAELFPANKFYTSKLSAIGVGFDVASLEDFSARFPFTTKAELVQDQQQNPPYGTDLTYPLDRYTRFHQTSGTSGVPLRWLDTPESWDWMVTNWAEIFRASGVVAGDRVYFAFTFGPFIGFWIAYEAASRLGAMCLPGGGLSSMARLNAMLDSRATVLCCTPTYALRLAEVAAQEGIDTRRLALKRMIVAGEPGGSIPSTRAKIEELWPGVKVFDHHGMTETGPVTYECPLRPGVLHVIESAYYAEVVDSGTGEPVKPGNRGELVLTTLGRTGSPLLRYRTGDIVMADASDVCVCGRCEMALVGGILGRADDMIVVRGVNIYPAAVEDVIQSVKGIREYEVRIATVQSMTELSVTIEPEAGCCNIAALVDALEKAFQNRFHLRVEVRAVPMGKLPRFEMKAHRWIRE
jgi:phenylacetate-CoA ligase